MEKRSKDLKIIGRLVQIDIPQWNINEIEAKIDTGAYTSSIHCNHIAPVNNGKVRFNLLDPSHPAYNDKILEMPIIKTKAVKSSNGKVEERFVIKTVIVLEGQKIEAHFSLTDRSEMRYPLLIGRRVLRGRFLVDVSK
ncbi:MAG TPA: RimK/LysX family protein [Balneolaceae bacterium]|nr:RimK/LysX family protein [Balneolaceae bacterium]